MKIREYIPSFCSGFENHVSEFNTKEELLDIDWIKCEMEDNDFSGYMVDGGYLIETFNYNTDKKPSWYVIGSFDDIETGKNVKKWFPQLKYGVDFLHIFKKAAKVFGIGINEFELTLNVDYLIEMLNHMCNSYLYINNYSVSPTDLEFKI